MTSDRKFIAGHATSQGTARFRDRFAAHRPGHYRPAGDLWLSSIGMGTYLGEPTPAVDASYRQAVTRAVELGTNVIDTAVNYRHQRSERAIGEALGAMIAAGRIERDEIFIATKGGFLTYDGEEPKDPSRYFHETYVATGLVRPGDVAAQCHVMSPGYLANQIDVSRRNLGIETIDLYYVHNPETQLSAVSRAEFYARLTAAFMELERAVAEGKIRAYGVATWNALRVSPDSADAVSLADVLGAAQAAGGREHHFRAVQLPFNLAMLEALAARTQSLDGSFVPFLRLAQSRHLLVFASASLLQGQLSAGMPEELRSRFPALATDAQRAIQFVRSAPGITVALVGMSQSHHVDENLGTAAVAPLTLATFGTLFRD